ncbi:MAG: hypothetical protein ABIW85_01555 [Variovorax sp.]
MPAAPRSPALPDGIGDEEIRPTRVFAGHASPLSLIVLSILLATALSGVLGGGPRTVYREHNQAGDFTVLAPRVSRNGNIVELRFQVDARNAIEKLVIGVDPGLWRQITTNSTMPQAADETFEEGLIRFSFGKVDAGASFELQVEQQINPDLIGINRGRIVFFDGRRALAELPMQLTVLP